MSPLEPLSAHSDEKLSEVRATAQALLAAHKRLREASDAEPPCNENGDPLDPAAWIPWHALVYKPAYNALDTAHIAFERARGKPTSRHPANFRPLCEEILA